MEVIRALAGHVDVRATQIYVDVTDQRKARGIAHSSAAASRQPAGGIGSVTVVVREPD